LTNLLLLPCLWAASIWEQCNIAEGIKEVKKVGESFRGFGVETPVSNQWGKTLFHAVRILLTLLSLMRHQVKDLDLQILTSNYTAHSLAAGLRDREETLQVSKMCCGASTTLYGNDASHSMNGASLLPW